MDNNTQIAKLVVERITYTYLIDFDTVKILILACTDTDARICAALPT